MSCRPRVALATAAAFPHLDGDGPLLLDALAGAGVDAEAAVWDDAGVAWSSYDLVVIRSCWDYAPRRDAFVAWAATVAAGTRLVNPAPVVRWNTDKRYLRELAAAGLPVVPTTWLEPGDPVRLPAEGEYVVKPAVSGGARDTTRYAGGRGAAVAATAHVARLLAAGRTVMVQPYLTAVDTSGETALVFVAGSYSHAIRKAPLLAIGVQPTEAVFAEEHITRRTPSAAERNVAEAALAAVPGGPAQLLYARVDLVPDADGAPVLLELELTEPSLFLGHADDVAAGRLARAIAAAVGSTAQLYGPGRC